MIKDQQVRAINCKALLEQNNILSWENWNRFSIKHSKPTTLGEKTKQVEFIKQELGLDQGDNPAGLYAYRQGDNLLYVGKGRPLFNRLKSHYRESYEPIPGDTRTKRWHRFFSAHTGDLTIYWIPVKDETTRKILELALQVHYKPMFESFR